MSKAIYVLLFLFFLSACAITTPAPTPTPTLPATRTPTLLPSPTATVAATLTPLPVPTVALRTNPLCATSALEELVRCIAAAMPRRDSNEYDVPTADLLDMWQAVVQQMLMGKCDEIDLPLRLKSTYIVHTFNDKDKKDYCVAAEIADANKDGRVDHGWGTFIVNNKPARELSIQAPHPLFDLDTENQAIGVFKQVGARSFLLAGAHRDANQRRSVCEPDTGDGEADGSHNENTLFQRAVIALNDFYHVYGKSWNAIQFHGMGASSCPNVDAFISMGSASPPNPGSIALVLKANILSVKPNWVVTVPGDAPPCNLTATTNVAGRLLNGVPAANVCTLPAATATGKFIHIEQKREMRVVSEWAQAIVKTWQ